MLPNPEIFDALNRHGVPFVVVGGHAVIFHGYTRLTEDTDIVWLRSAESELALLAALADINAQYIGNDIDPVTRIERTYQVSLAFIQSQHLMMLWTSKGFLDLFDYIPGFPETPVEELFDASIAEDGVRYTSLVWLRKMKRAAGRHKDHADLENLPGEQPGE